MIAGQRRQQSGMTVDYMDVMRQAIENERWIVLREIRDAIDGVPTTYSTDKYPYSEPRDADKYRDDLVKEIRRIENRYRQ